MEPGTKWKCGPLDKNYWYSFETATAGPSECGALCDCTGWMPMEPVLVGWGSKAKVITWSQEGQDVKPSQETTICVSMPACNPPTPTAFHRSSLMVCVVAKNWGKNLTVGKAGPNPERKLWKTVIPGWSLNYPNDLTQRAGVKLNGRVPRPDEECKLGVTGRQSSDVP